MIDVFIPYKGFLSVGKVSTDNTVFRLHYKVTVIMLIISMLLVTSKQLFGDPILCIGGDEKMYKEVVNSFCWIYGTYTVRSRLSGVAGKQHAFAGVGPGEGAQDEIAQTYYQWVFIALMLQAVMFYFPRYLWKIWERGHIKALTDKLDGPMVPAEWSQERKADLVAYLLQSNVYAHNMYAVRFAFCEMLNLVNVVLQIFLLNLFLGGSFATYGAAVAAFNRNPNSLEDMRAADPMTRYFPKVAKCLFRYYGSSGDIQERDLLCILPINIINEKIYIVLWFWLMFLAAASVLTVVQRVVVFACPPLRTLFLMGQLRYAKLKRRYVSNIVRSFHFGDWFVLHQLGKNLNPIIYKELVEELSNQLESHTVLI